MPTIQANISYILKQYRQIKYALFWSTVVCFLAVTL